MTNRLFAVLIAVAFALRAEASALTYTYDLNSNAGPITLTFDADDADQNERLRFRRGIADLSSMIDITLSYLGTDYTLIGAVDPDTSLFDRNAQTLSVIVADAARPEANRLTTVQLSFGQRVRGIRTLGDFFAYLAGATITGGNLTIAPGVSEVPLPATPLLFLSGAALFARVRRLGR